MAFAGCCLQGFANTPGLLAQQWLDLPLLSQLGRPVHFCWVRSPLSGGTPVFLTPDSLHSSAKVHGSRGSMRKGMRAVQVVIARVLVLPWGKALSWCRSPASSS